MRRSWKGTIALACAVAFAVACGSSDRQGFDDGDGGPGSENGADGSSNQFGNSDGGEGGSLVSAPSCADASCACALAGGTFNAGVCTLSENPGSVDPGTQGQLTTGGTADGAFKLVYPYDGTVFPQGLNAPTVQWNGTSADAVLVHLSSPTLDYKGWFGKSSPGRAQPGKSAWSAITLSVKPTDTLKLEVTKISSGAVSGPQTESLKVANGSLRGVIYYETYGSTILGGIASVGIMKIQPGATAPTAVVSGCGNVCHTASADGSTLVAATGFAGITSTSYNLKSGFTVKKAQGDQSFVYGGLYPNGSLVVSATNYRTWTGGQSKIYDTNSGTALSAPGWDGTIKNAAMPAFSPDGSLIVFNHEDTGNGHSLATMGFVAASRTFSGLTDVVTDNAHYLGWPAFTPDSKTVVYHSGSNELFETDADQDGGAASTGDLYAVDLATKKTARLDQLDGYSGASSYLPDNDPDLNFAPTVLPEAVGGYFWVVFTSHRSYGNTLPSKDNGDQNGKLWVAAVDINGTAGTDPSHPAFYLDGQESVSDNLRGFWVLDPCKDDGNGCTSGDECCGGFCRPGAGGALACVTNPGGCSNEYEKCTQASDCCGTNSQCINGKCAGPAVK